MKNKFNKNILLKDKVLTENSNKYYKIYNHYKNKNEHSKSEKNLNNNSNYKTYKTHKKCKEYNYINSKKYKNDKKYKTHKKYKKDKKDKYLRDIKDYDNYIGDYGNLLNFNKLKVLQKKQYLVILKKNYIFFLSELNNLNLSSDMNIGLITNIKLKEYDELKKFIINYSKKYDIILNNLVNANHIINLGIKTTLLIIENYKIMKELGVKSANGTNNNNDRKLMNDKLFNLIKESNRLVSLTEWNNIYLLLGNPLSFKINIRSAEFSKKHYHTLKEIKKKGSYYNNKINTTTKKYELIPSYQAGNIKYKLKLNNNNVNTVLSEKNFNKYNEFNINNQNLSIQNINTLNYSSDEKKSLCKNKINYFDSCENDININNELIDDDYIYWYPKIGLLSKNILNLKVNLLTQHSSIHSINYINSALYLLNNECNIMKNVLFNINKLKNYTNMKITIIKNTIEKKKMNIKKSIEDKICEITNKLEYYNLFINNDNM